MYGLVQEIGSFFWRLIPANPILLRVVQMNGKRKRDLFIRCGYLGLLIGVVLLSLMGGSYGDLSAMAKTSRNLFQVLSYCQLALVALLAPIFTAGAITAEKDSQTYDILLATPLSNGQIVLGSLLSRLFFVIALLISGIPVFAIIRIFGGVPINVITQSFLISAATAFVTGAVAMAIAVLKVGTRRTIFSFYMFIVVYMVGTFVLDLFGYLKFDVLNTGTNVLEPSKTSWLTGINPFLALRTIYHDAAYLPPSIDALPPALRGWPARWYLSDPANFYVTVMFVISFVLILPSVVLLRRLAQSTTSIRTLVVQKLGLARGDRTRKPRVVWNNPIAWREAKTKASAARASLLRYGFILAGLGGAVAMLIMFSTLEPPKVKTYILPNSFNRNANTLTIYSKDGGAPATVSLEQAGEPRKFGYTDEQSPLEKRRRDLTIDDVMTHTSHGRLPAEMKDGNLEFYSVNRRLGEADAHRGLFGMTVVELAVILLIVANAAASTVTREKEDGTLDLLLSSPITSRYYIWGKLRGLVSFVLPLVAVPVVSAGLFVCYDLTRLSGNWNDPDFQWIVLPEALVLLPLVLIITAAFASILGMNMSLRCRKTVVAVMSSVGIVTGICGAMGWCGYSFLASQNPVGLFVSAFSPFTLLMVLINPFIRDTDGERFVPLFGGADAIGNRVLVVVLTLIAVTAYTAIVWAMYKSMVKNFDMTIRKQSR